MEAWDVLVECFQKLENCQAYVIDNRRLYDTIGQMIDEIHKKNGLYNQKERRK